MRERAEVNTVRRTAQQTEELVARRGAHGTQDGQEDFTQSSQQSLPKGELPNKIVDLNNSNDLKEKLAGKREGRRRKSKLSKRVHNRVLKLR